MPKNCPFCGETLRATNHGGYAHPGFQSPTKSSRCWLDGWHIGEKRVELWDKRTGGIHFEVVDGYPVFNEDGKGRSVDAATLQSFFDYLKGK